MNARVAIRRALDMSSVEDNYDVNGLVDDIMTCLLADNLAITPAAELDRLRSELAAVNEVCDDRTRERNALRTAGDELAAVKNWVGHVVKAEQWRLLRGGVPAVREAAQGGEPS